MIDFKEFDTILPKPPEADNIGVEEVMQKIQSGETDIQPSPWMSEMDAEHHRFKIMAFERTERYQDFDDSQKKTLADYFRRVEGMLFSMKLHAMQVKAQSDPEFASALSDVMNHVGGGMNGGGGMPPPIPVPVGGNGNGSAPIA